MTIFFCILMWQIINQQVYLTYHVCLKMGYPQTFHGLFSILIFPRFSLYVSIVSPLKQPFWLRQVTFRQSIRWHWRRCASKFVETKARRTSPMTHQSWVVVYMFYMLYIVYVICVIYVMNCRHFEYQTSGWYLGGAKLRYPTKPLIFRMRRKSSVIIAERWKTGQWSTIDFSFTRVYYGILSRWGCKQSSPKRRDAKPTP